MASGPITEAIQRTKKLEWSDVIYTAKAYMTPFLALLPQAKKPVQVECNWPVDDLDDVGYGGRMDSLDVTEFNHQNRDSLKAVSQWFLESWKVSHFADLTSSWGVKDEAKYQAAKALLRLKLKIERGLLSDMDCARESGVDQPNELRGAFRWLENSAASLNTEYPIGDDYRVSSSCEYTGAVASFLEATLEDMLVAAANEVNQAVTWDAQLGLDLQTQMDDFTAHDPTFTTTNQVLKSYVSDASDKSFLKQVDFFKFSAGTVRTHVNYNLMHTKATGAASAYSPKSGLFLNMDQWRIAFMNPVSSHRLENKGGGPRGYHDATLTLKCGVPLGQARVKSNS